MSLVEFSKSEAANWKITYENGLSVTIAIDLNNSEQVESIESFTSAIDMNASPATHDFVAFVHSPNVRLEANCNVVYDESEIYDLFVIPFGKISEFTRLNLYADDFTGVYVGKFTPFIRDLLRSGKLIQSMTGINIQCQNNIQELVVGDNLIIRNGVIMNIVANPLSRTRIRDKLTSAGITSIREGASIIFSV
jgi:hypothetical protein